ncbi:MAG: hypothetical protein KA831_09560 [Pyrinomonadaceae bacterium]|nr:hypothetical protein [Pyrinomonadaceae bacterium]
MAGNYAPCPQCGDTNAQLLSFTWWGGLIGPKLLTHVKCPACGKKFNGKSGKDNTVGIALYMVAISIFVFVLVGAIAVMVAMN